jgi:hypothetical protein
MPFVSSTSSIPPRWTFVDARWTLCSEHIAELDDEITC